MNVLFLALDVDPSGRQGDAVHVRELARALAERGTAVDVVAAGATRGPTTSGLTFHIRPRDSDWRVARFCADLARRAKAQVVYERRLSPKVGFTVSRLVSVPLVLEVNGVEEEASILGRTEMTPWRPVKVALRRRMYRGAKRVVAVTDRLAEHVRERYHVDPSRLVVVPNGVDPSTFVPMDRTVTRRSLSLPETPTVLFVGNLVPWQGLETLLASAQAVLRRLPKSRFVIVGDGVSRDALQRLATALDVAASVSFVGGVEHERIPYYIGAADVCVAPFTRMRNEAIGLSPLKVYEYMACARPAVASDLSGIGDLLRTSGGGILVPPDDADRLAGALHHLLHSPDEARAMGERGRAYVASECSWARTAERVERVLRDAVEAAR